ncbi:ERD1/XPR1/SYG1 protein [Tanacetum coccineum]
MWEAIKTRNLGADRVKEARLQTLITEFENLKMSDNDTIDAYAAKLSGIGSKSAMLGEVMSEHKLIKKFLTSLPRRFVHIMADLEQVIDLKTTGFEDVLGRLKVYKERVKQKDKKNDSQEKLLYARTDYSNRNGDSSRGIEKYTPPKSESNTDEDDVWYFDNGANNHMTGKNGEQKLLKDIYYILALCSNVISLGQATISGCDIHIQGDFSTMRDSCGSLLIKVPRSANCLYKTQLKVRKPYCLEANIDEESLLWHVRIGHIGFGAMNLMHKLAKGVPVIKHQDQVCESCMLESKQRSHFRRRQHIELQEYLRWFMETYAD